MLITHRVSCPYCGERFEAQLDLSSGSHALVEDCHVCCRPIDFEIEVDALGGLGGVTLKRQDE